MCRETEDVERELGTAMNLFGFATFKTGEASNGLTMIKEANKIFKRIEGREFDIRRTKLKRSGVMAHLGIIYNLRGK